MFYTFSMKHYIYMFCCQDAKVRLRGMSTQTTFAHTHTPVPPPAVNANAIQP